MQILDEGFVTDAKGEKIDFKNTMIFMTSNVINQESVGFINKENDTLNENFSKEFLGRFTDIIPFENIKDTVIDTYIKKNLTNKKIRIQEIKQEAECEKFGLRNLKHLIEKYNNEMDIEIPL